MAPFSEYSEKSNQFFLLFFPFLIQVEAFSFQDRLMKNKENIMVMLKRRRKCNGYVET